MKKRGLLAQKAREIAAAHGVSLRQAYRYAAAGRLPSECIRVGGDGRRYHVHTSEVARDAVEVRRIRYTVASVAKRAAKRGITNADLAELETAIERINELAAEWRSWPITDAESL